MCVKLGKLLESFYLKLVNELFRLGVLYFKGTLHEFSDNVLKVMTWKHKYYILPNCNEKLHYHKNEGGTTFCCVINVSGCLTKTIKTLFTDTSRAWNGDKGASLHLSNIIGKTRPLWPRG